MRTDTERLAAMHMRAAEIKKQKDMRTLRIAEVCSVTAALALIVLLAFFMPHPGTITDAGGVYDAFYASIFTGSPVLGYIVIGVVAFLLGIAVTVFCFLMKKRHDRENMTVPRN